MESVILFFLLCRRWGVFVICGLALSFGNAAGAADTITVTVRSGRQFKGVAAARTDSAQLWLQSGSSQLHVLRPIDWDRIERVQSGALEESGPRFRDRILAAAKPAAANPRQTHYMRSAKNRGESVETATSNAAPESFVRSLSLSAWIGRWEDGVAPDGVVISIAPLDDTGQLLRVNGTLEVELFGLGRLDRPDTERIEQLGRWTQAVYADQYSMEGLVARFPWQAEQPEFVRHLEWPGAVHVQLAVPGHGVFDATCEPMVIRSASEFRHRLDQLQGARFLPTERTGIGQTWHTPGWIEQR